MGLPPPTREENGGKLFALFVQSFGDCAGFGNGPAASSLF